MARTAARLQRDGAPWKNPRLPIAAARVESYPSLSDEARIPFVEVMLPIEESELASAFDPGSPDRRAHSSTSR